MTSHKPSPTQRVARLYHRLRTGDKLTARQIADLVGFKHAKAAYRLMPLLEREDADLVRDAAIDFKTDRPILVWYLRHGSEIGE